MRAMHAVTGSATHSLYSSRLMSLMVTNGEELRQRSIVVHQCWDADVVPYYRP